MRPEASVSRCHQNQGPSNPRSAHVFSIKLMASYEDGKEKENTLRKIETKPPREQVSGPRIGHHGPRSIAPLPLPWMPRHVL